MSKKPEPNSVNKPKPKRKSTSISEHPGNIYDYIADIITSFETKLGTLSDDAHIDNAKKQTLEIILEFKRIKVDTALTELKKYQEWDTYTIAFYGETNAGKSTIIESLRIYFHEKTKVETITKFQEIFETYTNKLDHLENELSKSKALVDEYDRRYTAASSDFDILKADLEKEIFTKNELDDKKREESIWYKLISFLNLSPLKKEIGELKSKLLVATKNNHTELNKIKKDKDFENKKIEDLINEVDQHKDSHVSILSNLSDGQIIGDGRSDFTQHTTEYFFTHNQENFSFLDIPGIEGKESVVIDEIASAVKKAHAVFYVTSNPVPPQKGDNGKQGTLEKISEHLSSQTEIYTLFNKRVTNPMQLEKQLISDDEESSLKVLNEKMIETIGENYSGNKNLSAKISFLALAECLVPNGKISEEKNKFLKKYTKDDLLQKALLLDFVDFLTSDLVQNTKQKIKKSNYNKANNILKELGLILQTASTNNFHPLYKQLSKELEDASENLNNTFQITKKRMSTEASKAIRNFANSTRKDIYSYIDSDVSDDSFEVKLKSVIEETYKITVDKLPVTLENEYQIFQDEANKVIDNFYRRANETMQDFRSISLTNSNTKFKLEINLDNGIDGWGLAGSLAGAGGLAYSAIMFSQSWNPIGWTMFAIGAVTVIVGFAKSVFKFFSTSYKMSEQKKSADENIDRIASEIEKNVLQKLKSPFVEFEEVINKIITQLTTSVEQVNQINIMINDTVKELTKISNNIQIEGSN